MKASQLIRSRCDSARDISTQRVWYSYAAMSVRDVRLRPATRLLLCAIIGRCESFDGGAGSIGSVSFIRLTGAVGCGPDTVAAGLNSLVRLGYIDANLTHRRGYSFRVHLARFVGAPTTFETAITAPEGEEIACSYPEKTGVVTPGKSGSKGVPSEHLEKEGGARAAPSLRLVPQEVCGPKDSSSGLGKALRSFSAPDGPRAPRGKPPRSEVLVAAYVSCRRSFDPLYEVSPGGRRALAVAEGKLRVARVQEHRWPVYVRWLFDFVASWGKADYPCPAPKDLSADGHIERFSAMTRMRIDSQKARAFLAARGYKSMVGVAIEIAMNLLNGEQPRSYSEEAQEAGRWLAENIESVGTVEDLR